MKLKKKKEIQQNHVHPGHTQMAEVHSHWLVSVSIALAAKCFEYYPQVFDIIPIFTGIIIQLGK